MPAFTPRRVRLKHSSLTATTAASTLPSNTIKYIPMLQRSCGHYGLEGVYNFDMILAPDGCIYYLECNPRFFYKINLSMIAGINFVEFGLPGERSTGPALIPDGTSVRFPSAVLASLASGGRPTKRDWAMATYIYSDPLPHFYGEPEADPIQRLLIAVADLH